MRERVLGNVGLAIKAAIERAQEHERLSPRKLRVRLMTRWGDDSGGVTIAARFAARSVNELEAQRERGMRRVAWEDLDARASDLSALVDEAVADAEDAIGVVAAQ